MFIRDVMSRTVFSVSPDAKLQKICQIMEKNSIGSVVIIKDRYPIGIVTERDVVNVVALQGGAVLQNSAQQIMKGHLITMNPKQDLKEALQVMIDKRIRRLPICEKKSLVGILTYGDVMREIQKELAEVNVKAQQLKKEAVKDGLTGLFNQQYFKIALDNQMERVKRYGGVLTLLMVDVDFFKKINDQNGHDAGDLVLQKVATLIRRNTRKVNIVGRYGGDEFGLIAPISDVEGGRQLGERLRDIVERTKFHYKDIVIHVTLSIGVAGWDKAMLNGRDLIVKADKALYLSKRAGRNKVSIGM